MTDILDLVFRTFTSATAVRKQSTACPSPPTCSTLLVGEERVSRAVLLLAAVSAASELGLRVVFFTRTQIQSLPLSLQRCLPSLSPDTLKKIRFCYPRTVEELLQQVASLHESTYTSPVPPSLVIVDGLEGYLCRPGGASYSGYHTGEQTCAAHLSALLCDSVAFMTQLLKQRCPNSPPCRLLASFQPQVDSGPACSESSTTDLILDVLDRYFQARCTLDPDRSYEAAAAGLQEVWHMYLSGTDTTEAASGQDCEARPRLHQEWQLLIHPDGLMEFRLA